MPNFNSEFSFRIENLTQTEYRWCKKKLAEWISEAEEFGEPNGFSFEFQQDTPESDWALWIFSETEGRTDRVSDFCQEFLEGCRPTEYIAFEFAATCSKPALDAFGGGAMLITVDDIHWMNTFDWMAQKITEWKDRVLRATLYQEGDVEKFFQRDPDIIAVTTKATPLKVKIDGDEAINAESVRIYREDKFGEDEIPGVLEIHATHEGLIMDVWPDGGEESIGTSSEKYNEIADRLMDEG